jgi:hypothetical protein
MKDIPTPESDAARFISEYITQEDAVPYELSQSLEKRLAIAVAALQSISEYWNGSSNERAMTDACEHNRNAAAEALAQIEESK